MHDFKKLDVWKISIDFVTEIYRITETFPKTKIYGLTNQIRKSTVSIPSNIAEGAGRKNNGEFRLFLGYDIDESLPWHSTISRVPFVRLYISAILL